MATGMARLSDRFIFVPKNTTTITIHRINTVATWVVTTDWDPYVRMTIVRGEWVWVNPPDVWYTSTREPFRGLFSSLAGYPRMLREADEARNKGKRFWHQPLRAPKKISPNKSR